MSLKVSNPKYLELKQACALVELSRHVNVKKLVKFNGELYLVTSTALDNVYGYRVVSLFKYMGKTPPIIYNEHLMEVRFGKREKHQYSGIKFAFKNEAYVIVGKKVQFENSNSEVQCSLF